MPVVGTGGHVDHGKSTLVQALTGRDPDRWKEEKERGLTIDLGFAWTTLGNQEVSFVDVPGHERFIKNMLAGSGGFDVALLVVAADEGWMPQSEEHLAGLDLLDIRNGVVALTKIDRADPDLIELSMLEVEERLEGTSLEGSPIIPVSALTGEGLDRLCSSLAEKVAAANRYDDTVTRLWIDRVFPIAGAGTVVTGTLVGGTLRVGEEVEILPDAGKGRIRSLQAHETERNQIGTGTRTAVGVAGPDRDRIARGSMLGRPGEWLTGRRRLVVYRTARYVKRPLSGRGAYQLHLGSGAWPVRLVPAGEVEDQKVGVLITDHPLPVKMGDRFILRDVGRRLIVAGGQILDPAAPSRTAEANRAAKALIPALNLRPDRQATALLEWRGAERPSVLSAHSGGGIPEKAVGSAEWILSRSYAQRLIHLAQQVVADFHRENHLRPGMPKASLSSQLGIGLETLAAVLSLTDRLRARGSVVAQVGFGPRLHPSEESEWERIRTVLESTYPTVPKLQEIGAEAELVHALAREGRLIRISEDFVYLPLQVEALLDRLRELSDGFTVADFRDATGLTRKYAVPFLEWTDRQGITTRHQNERTFTGDAEGSVS